VTGSATGSNTDTADLDGTASGNSVTGAIADGSGGGVTALSKTNSSTWTLAGANTYSGASSVTGGVLNVTGSIASTASLTVTGATLEGTGSITSPVSMGASSFLAPGKTTSGSLGTLSTGAVTMIPTATLTYVLNSNAPSTSDLLAVTGNLTLGGATLSASDAGSTVLANGTTIELASYTGTLSGTFSGLADTSRFTIGANTYQINYGTLTSDEITLEAIAVPEPSTYTLLWLGGLGLLAWSRYFRRVERASMLS
jgi:autotransporter-associated beta strand protein